MAEPVILSAAGIGQVTLKSGVTAKVGDLIGHDGTDYVLADADGRIPASFIAMQYLAGDGTAKLAVCQSGTLYDSDAPYTAGSDQYLSNTAGAHTTTMPAASSTLTVIQRIGKALSTTDMAFDLNRRGPTTLRVQTALDPANNASDAISNNALAVTGILTTDYVQGFAPAALEAGVVPTVVWPSNADEISVRVQNPTAGAVNGASRTWDFLITRL